MDAEMQVTGIENLPNVRTSRQPKGLKVKTIEGYTMSELNKHYKTSKGIYLPILKWVRLSELTGVNLNREEHEPLVDSMEDGIRDIGFAATIAVTPYDGDVYPIADGHHRKTSMERIHSTKGNPWIPVCILWWVDSEDMEDVQAKIVSLNIHGRGWSIFDFVKSHAEMNKRPNHKLFVKIYKAMKHYAAAKTLTNGIVAGIFSEQMMGHTTLRSGKLNMNDFKLQYVDRMLDKLSTIVTAHGKTKVSNQFLRRYVVGLWKEALSGAVVDFEKWVNFFEHTHNQIETLCSVKTFPGLPDGDVSFNEWWGNIQTSYNRSTTK